MDGVRYRYASLDDFLASSELTVDAQLDDGWGAKFPLKGRELEATVLFSDISGFSARTRELNPTATLARPVHGRAVGLQLTEVVVVT